MTRAHIKVDVALRESYNGDLATGIPSTGEKLQFFLRSTTQEAFAVFIGVLGVVVASWPKVSPSTFKLHELALALYTPDLSLRSERLHQLGTEHHQVDWFQVVGLTISCGAILIWGYVKIKRAQAQDDRDNLAKSPDGLRGCAHVLNRVLRARLGLDSADDGKVRVTIYSVLETEKGGAMLEQSIEYVGDSSRNKSGRRLPVSKGIVGLSYRTKEPQRGYREPNVSDDQYKQSLIKDHGFEVEDVAKMSLDRMSFISFPITGDQQKVIAVVYIDTTEIGVFEDNALVVELSEATGGFAAYIEERFN